MKKIIAIFLNIVLGVSLLAGFVLTGAYVKDNKNQEMVARALQQQSNVDIMGFNNFTLSNYPITLLLYIVITKTMFSIMEK